MVSWASLVEISGFAVSAVLSTPQSVLQDISTNVQFAIQGDMSLFQ
jgi:hypothetical protein